MKVNITMKSPDATFYAMNDLQASGEFDEDQLDEIAGRLSRHFTYGEYLNLEYDTETDTLEIVKP
ncbi:hypothetical protein AAY80_150 [Stenotrophomonas phage vB_SmaS-DLP_6]|nr:hypothetical protein AAY80_150 [Stenotrophomonas phage vB_SmaS-DLP_6]